MDNLNKHKPTKVIIVSVVAAVMAAIVFCLAVFMIISSGHETSTETRIDESASVVILSYQGDKTIGIQNKWLANSLEHAGLPVYRLELDRDSSGDFSSLISSWHNWKQERLIDQGRVWLISSGLESDLAVEIALSWEDSDLLLLPNEEGLKYFTDWQDFTSSISLRWPDDKALLIYHTANTKNEAASLFERVSDEDAWLFPGEDLYRSSTVSVINSSDGRFALAQIDTGLLAAYGWSSSYVDAITSDITVRSMNYAAAPDAAARIDNASRALRIEWFILPLSVILLIIISSLVGLAENFISAWQLHLQKEMISTDNSEEFHIHRSSRYLLGLRIILISAFAATSVVLLAAIGLLPLLTVSWWLTALVFVFVMIALIPDARIGIADRQLEKTTFIRIVSGVIWVVIIAASAVILLRSLVVEPVPVDSIVWLISGLGLIVAGKTVVRPLSSIRCRVWFVLPAGAWMIINGASIISHFAGFH